MRWRGLLVVTGLIAAALLWWRFTMPSAQDPLPDAPQSSTRPASPAAPATEPDAPAAPVHDGAAADSTCLTPLQLQHHPALMAELDRLRSVIAGGPDVEVYRGLPEQQVAIFAEQGDSAAMVVLGAMHVMRARGRSDSDAVAYLASDDPELQRYVLERPLSEASVGHYMQASEWFYRAALHGRLLALTHFGDQLGTLGLGPVQLGWIDEAAYEALSPYERSALLPTNVYSAAAFAIAPGLREGPLHEMVSEIRPGSERQSALVAEVAADYERDRERQGLPAPAVQSAQAPSLDELNELLCEEYR